MPSEALSVAIRAKLVQLFPPEQVSAAVALLENGCGSGLPLIAAQGIVGIERVRCAVLRRLISAGAQIAGVAYDMQGDAEAAVDKAEQILFALTQRRRAQEFERAHQLRKELPQRKLPSTKAKTKKH